MAFDFAHSAAKMRQERLHFQDVDVLLMLPAPDVPGLLPTVGWIWHSLSQLSERRAGQELSFRASELRSGYHFF